MDLYTDKPSCLTGNTNLTQGMLAFDFNKLELPVGDSILTQNSISVEISWISLSDSNRSSLRAAKTSSSGRSKDGRSCPSGFSCLHTKTLKKRIKYQTFPLISFFISGDQIPVKVPVQIWECDLMHGHKLYDSYVNGAGVRFWEGQTDC